MNTRVEEAEEQISDIENKIMENNEAKQRRERRIMEHEVRLTISDAIKHNIYNIGAPEEEEERGKKAENLFEEMIAGNFLNLRKETDIQIPRSTEISH